MNILMISMDYPPTPGGISAHVKELAAAMARDGHQVTVLTRRQKNQQDQEYDGAVRVFRLRLRYLALLYGRQINAFTRSLLPDLKPDIIHIHGMLPLEWYDITSPPLAYTNHTSGYLRRVQKGGFRRMNMLKRHFGKVHLFLAPSRELLQVPFAIKASRHFIANGVDEKKYGHNPAAREKLRKQLKLNEEDKLGLITRRLVDKNGVIYLARAAARLQDPRLHFLVIGDGPERKAVEQEFRRHLGNRVSFTGAMTHEQIIPYYSAADFSVLPSLLEATSISGLEAMAAGLPLVGSEVGGIPELIREGFNGYLCRPGDPEDLADKINYLTSQDMARLGHNSRELVHEQFTWQRIARQTVDAYKKTLQTVR